MPDRVLVLQLYLFSTVEKRQRNGPEEAAGKGQLRRETAEEHILRG
jgi:hypothetical protein